MAGLPRFFSQLRPVWFFAAFVVGIAVTYIMAPKPEIVLKFPSPKNAGQVVYHDADDNCYAYDAEKVSCPEDGKLVREQPVAVGA